MSLNWEWKNKIGELNVTRQWKDTPTREIKLDLYQGNALMIAIWQDETQYQLYTFFADEEHMKNCFGLTKGHEMIFDDYDKWTKITLYTDVNYKYLTKLVNAITKAFKNITIELTERPPF